MYCGKCGAKNDEDDLFCINCGNKLKKIENQGFPTESKKVNDKIINNQDGSSIKEDVTKGNSAPDKSFNKGISTVWLDFITTVWCLWGIFYIILGLISLFSGNEDEFANGLILTISGVIYVLSLYYVHTRSKSGYYFFIYVIISNFAYSLFNGIISKYNDEYLVSYTIITIIGYCIFLIPNLIYIKKEKTCLYLKQKMKIIMEEMFFILH